MSRGAAMISRPPRTRRPGGPLAVVVSVLVLLALLAGIGALAVSVGRVHVDLSRIARTVVERLAPKPTLPQPIRRLAPPQGPATLPHQEQHQ